MVKVAFVCVGNAGRSQMAAAFAHRLRPKGVAILSGGTRPAAHVNPTVDEAMREVGIDLSNEVPKALGPADLADCDYVVTMGCSSEDVCPAKFRGDALDWALPDPMGKGLDELRRRRDDIERRVRAFLDEVGA